MEGDLVKIGDLVELIHYDLDGKYTLGTVVGINEEEDDTYTTYDVLWNTGEIFTSYRTNIRVINETR